MLLKQLALLSVVLSLVLLGCCPQPGAEDQAPSDGDSGQIIPDIGPQGPQGEIGPMGPQGLPGQDGIDGIGGKDGVEGIDGEDGQDGKDGADGEDGIDGKDGIDGESSATKAAEPGDDVCGIVRDLPSGGVVYLKEGVYMFSDPLVIARDNITIEGAGEATRLVLSPHVGAPVVVIGDPYTLDPGITKNVHIRNLIIDGNSANQDSALSSWHGITYLGTTGITIRGAVNCSVENLTVVNAKAEGILFQQANENVQLISVLSAENLLDGISLAGPVTKSLLTGCTVRDNYGSGIYMSAGASENIVRDCMMYDNGGDGILLSDARNNTFSNCLIDGNALNGILISPGGAGATGNYFSGVRVSFNTKNGIRQDCESCTANFVDGAIFQANGLLDVANTYPATAPLIVYDSVSIP